MNTFKSICPSFLTNYIHLAYTFICKKLGKNKKKSYDGLHEF